MEEKLRSNNFIKVRGEFEALGYHKWTKYQAFSVGDIWYRFGAPELDTFHVAYLGFQPRAKSYRFRLGGFNLGQLSLLEAMTPVFYKYMQSSNAATPKFSTILSWGLFVPSRGRYLNLSRIPSPLDRSSWREQLSIFENVFLKDLFWNIDGPEKLMDILLRDEFPLEWVVTPPVLRAAQVVALSHILGWSTARIKKELTHFRALIEKRMVLANDFDVMIDEFIRASGQHR